ncbi:MAG TPA: hypothetical protein PK466_13805 [Thermotogota bacterium]|nr:hypothetical protein [Thermotogota bacterium]HPJ90205.1 hypothetical protein [Thermotogota bacterium]HPR97401.1 hypothetical protein [Thermotogota bacterium]
MTKELLGKIREMEEKLGQDWLREFESVATVDLLKAKAEEYGITLTEEQAKEAFSHLNGNESEELSDEELSAVAGGKGSF